MPKRREKTVDEGDARIIYDYAPSPDDGLDLARSILSECPEGYHPWRVEGLVQAKRAAAVGSSGITGRGGA
jgi:hypothetical protein